MEFHRCLVSQEIGDLIALEEISGGFEGQLDKRIQPASFEPTIGDKVFVLGQEIPFRANEKEQVYRTLLKIPSRKRQLSDIVDGFEIKVGYTYLFPLQESLKNLPDGFIVKASPKSTMGRLFHDVRLIADYSVPYNEIRINESNNKNINLWLMVKPLTFNSVVYPGISMNQIRFLTGPGAQLSYEELKKEYQDNPFLFKIDEKGEKIPINKPDILGSGLRISLNLEGQHTHNVVGLKARKNPFPIDLRYSKNLPVDDFFECIQLKNDSNIIIIPEGGYYLLSSSEEIHIPTNLCGELCTSHSQALKGRGHLAGFFDNGFKGTATFEVTCDETENAVLINEMNISELELFRTILPHKIYGSEEAGSHYQNQFGPKPAKYFSVPDFGQLARNYAQLNRSVLVVPKEYLLSSRKQRTGFSSITLDELTTIQEYTIKNPIFASMYDCESDELLLQLIPYLIAFRDNEVLMYKRAEKIEDYGERKLHGKLSIGLGGHITEKDEPNYVENCLKRELAEEINFCDGYSSPIFVGTLWASEKPVDKVHFGLVYSTVIEGDVASTSKEILETKFIPIKDLQERVKKDDNFETWTRILIPKLNDIKSIYYSSLEKI